jgi:hypothetical protein
MGNFASQGQEIRKIEKSAAFYWKFLLLFLLGYVTINH